MTTTLRDRALYGAFGPTCAKDGDKVDGSRLWFNSFSDLLGDAVDIEAALAGVPVQAVAASVGQGENTTRFALACGAEINADAPGTLIAVGQQPKDLQPAKVTILNPGERSLTRLRKERLKKVEEMKKKGPTGVPAGAGGDSSAPDNAIANLSSIVMLVEAFGRRVLLTGDHFSLDILDGLESAQRWKKGQTFHVDIMKVPHHGSTANVQSEFVAAITADIYVFSANGKDQNPDPPVRAHRRRGQEGPQVHDGVHQRGYELRDRQERKIRQDQGRRSRPSPKPSPS